MLPVVTILDLETTGATPLRDRITEIALVRFEDGVEVARWQTLVNPEVPIPAFIQAMTGITDDMVQSAPKFEEVADTLLSYLEGSVLAAHNVRFDHGFLKNEYKRIGHTLRQRVLCTVKLSRKLYPQFHQHGLDAIMHRHQLTTKARHRAMGDVELLIDFLASAKAELGEETIAATAEELSKRPSLPSGIQPAIMDDIPETCGVYLFYGENDLPLYIGKSVNLRDRIMSHFSGDHASSKEMRISQEIKHIEWIETAGELGALLLESKLIKERLPIHNRQLRRERQLCSWQIAHSPEDKPLVTLVNEDEIQPEMIPDLFGTYRSRKQAIESLRAIAQSHELCPKYLALESGKGPCFASQLKRCRGVCCGKESPLSHYLRFVAAMASHRLETWPFESAIGVREYSEHSQKSELHVFNQWCHLGTVESEEELDELLKQSEVFAFNYDNYKILEKFLRKKTLKVFLIFENQVINT